MNYKQKLFYAFAGLIMGNVILGSIGFGIYYVPKNYPSKNEISFEEVSRRIERKEIKKVKVDGEKVEFSDINCEKFSANFTEEQIDKITQKSSLFGVTALEFMPASNSLAYLIQILFWLFFISPPIIVVLLLVIIKQMKANNSIK